MKVLLVDDHAVVRTGMKRLLESHQSVQTVYEAESGSKALKLIEEIKPDLVILDISMPDLSGIDVLMQTNKKGKIETKFLILSMYPEKEYALRVLKLGAFGYITKESAANELHHAIDSVISGKKYISSELQKIIFEKEFENKNDILHEGLSSQELKVFLLMAKGKRNQEIADELYISAKTVSTYKSRIFEKMGMDSVQQITKYALMHQLIK